MYSVALGWNALNISVKSIWSSVSFKALVSLLIFCLDDLSVGVSGVLKSLTIIVLLSISYIMIFKEAMKQINTLLGAISNIICFQIYF